MKRKDVDKVIPTILKYIRFRYIYINNHRYNRLFKRNKIKRN